MKNKLLNIYKLKKHFKKGLTPLLSALTVFNICCINASAAEYIVSFSSIEPNIPDIGGYIVTYGDTGLSQPTLSLYHVAFYPLEFDPEFNGNAEFNHYYDCDRISVSITDNSITYSYLGSDNIDGYDSGGYIVLYRLNSGGGIVPIKSDYIDISDNWSYTSYFADIYAFNIKGNFGRLESTFSKNNQLKILWGNDTVINDNIDKLNQKLDVLINGSNSNTDLDPVSESDILDVTNKENALIGSDVSTNDLNVSINANAASVVWNLVDDVVTRNAKVFTMFISILTIAVIGLILNR